MDYPDFINPSFIYAIVGATKTREKYGWIVFDNLRRKGLNVMPVNPKYNEIDGVTCYPDILALPDRPDVVVLVVPSEAGLKIVQQAAEADIDKIWCQPGAESEEIIKTAQAHGIHIVADGSCIMLASLELLRSGVATNYLQVSDR